MAISLISGIIHILKDTKYLQKWENVKYNIAKEIFVGEITEKNLSEINEKESKIPNKSSSRFIYIQIVFLFFGIALLIFLMSQILIFT